MSRPIHVSDAGTLHRYRTEIPNTIVRGAAGKTLSVNAKWLYVYLKSVAGDHHDCWQSTTTLAEGSGLSRMSVSRARQELARHGLIQLTAGQRKNRDAMCIRIVDIWSDNMQEFSSQCTTQVHQCTTQVHQQVVDTTEQLESGVPDRYTGVPHRYSGVPQEIHKKIPIRRSPEEKDKTLVSHSQNETGVSGGKYSQGFEAFWKTWPPSPRKEEKFYCFGLWKKYKLEARAEEVRGKIEAWCQTQKWREGFVPKPATWLNKRQFNDVVPGAAESHRRGEHEGHKIAHYPSGPYCHHCKREVLPRELAM